TIAPQIERLLAARSQEAYDEMERVEKCGHLFANIQPNGCLVCALLADERKPMECGHPKACWVQPEPEREEIFHEVTHDMAMDAGDMSLEGQPMPETIWHEKEPYCSACAEREKVREMCAKYLEKQAAECADFADKETGEVRAAWNRGESWYEDSADAIRQLDLTAPGRKFVLDEEGNETG
ncbi:hypothetical protein LCGC14_1959970, partial [marine sediment metagenome]